MSTVRLPLGYRRVEYILNSNNTYIDTGIYLSSDDHVIVNFGVNSTAARDRYLFGAWSGSGKSFWCNAYNGLANKGGRLYPRFGSLIPSNYFNSNGSLEIKERIWYFGGNSQTFDGTSEGEFMSDDYPCSLLGKEGGTYNNSDLMLSRFFIAGKFDGYACINPDGEAGIYDIQSQSFFKSPEGIAFVAGPLIEEEGFFQFADSRRRMMMEKSDIIITKESNPEVLAICYAQGWCAHENFMTMKEAMAVTDIGKAFDTTAIQAFDELRFFKNIGNLKFRSFFSCSQLTDIVIPDNVKIIRSYSFRGAFTKVSNAVRRMIIGSQLTQIESDNIYQWYNTNNPGTNIIICKAVVPPTLNTARNSGITKSLLYVPDDSVAAYQAAAQWSTAQSILPISQCPREYGEYQGLIKGNALDE